MKFKSQSWLERLVESLTSVVQLAICEHSRRMSWGPNCWFGLLFECGFETEHFERFSTCSYSKSAGWRCWLCLYYPEFQSTLEQSTGLGSVLLWMCLRFSLNLLQWFRPSGCSGTRSFSVAALQTLEPLQSPSSWCSRPVWLVSKVTHWTMCSQGACNCYWSVIHHRFSSMEVASLTKFYWYVSYYWLLLQFECLQHCD